MRRMKKNPRNLYDAILFHYAWFSNNEQIKSLREYVFMLAKTSDLGYIITSTDYYLVCFVTDLMELTKQLKHNEIVQKVENEIIEEYGIKWWKKFNIRHPIEYV